MKKILSAAAITFAFTAFASAFTWSGLIDNSTSLSTSDFKKFGLNQSNGIYLSMGSALSASGNVRFATEGMYKYNLNVADLDKGKSNFTNIADLTLLKLYGTWAAGNGSFELNAGRFSYSDLSSVVFSQASDGLNLAYDTSDFRIGCYAGYTGLLNSLNVSMTDAGKTSNKQFYNLCAGYIPLSLDLSYKTLFDSNVIGLQGIYFLKTDDKLTDKFYVTLSLNGPISTIGSYSIKGTVGSEKFENVMLYGAADFSAYLSSALVVTTGAEYASGNNFDGNVKSFKTITSSSACKMGGGIPLSGVFTPKLSAMLVYGKFYGNLTEKVVFAVPGNEMKSQGSDTSCSLIFNVLSDVQIATDISAYVEFNKKEYNYYSATLRASLAF